MEIASAVPASLDGDGGDSASAVVKPIPSSSPMDSPEIKYDGDDEGDVCRICRNPEDLDNPLRYPCACRGSIKYVHQNCIDLWLKRRKSSGCEVCKHEFSFSLVYAENAPTSLPIHEFIVGMVMKARHNVLRDRHVLPFFLSLCFDFSVRFLIIPLFTFWIWRLGFVRSFGEAQRLVLSHISFTVITTDCCNGLLLSTTLAFCFFVATFVRYFFMFLREFRGQNVVIDDDGDINGARAARRPPMQVNRVEVLNVDVAAGAQAIMGVADQIIRRNAEIVAALWEMHVAHHEAILEHIFDGINDAEFVQIDDLLGIRGAFFYLFDNSFTVLARNMIVSGAVIFVPFSLGRVILHYVPWNLVSAAARPVLLMMISLTGSANIALKNVLTSDGQNDNFLDTFIKVMSASATELNEANIITSSWISDVSIFAVGYTFIFSLAFLYLGTVALSSIAKKFPSIFQQFVAAMRRLRTMIKVTFLLVIELGVFPLMCGWWLDICTIRMFGKSFTQRVEFFSFSPLASSIVHWVVGILYMQQISVFLSLLKRVMRTGVLYFVRDPADPNYNSFRDLIDDPVHKHGRRVLLSVGVFGSLIVMLVFLPAKLAMRIAPSLFPLDISVSNQLTQILADILLFQICTLVAVKHFKLRTKIMSVLRYWFAAVGWAFGLTDFLLPGPEENSGNGNQIMERLLNPYNSVGRSVLSNNIPADEESESEYDFAFRIVLLLVVAWITLLIFNSILIVVPISLGRTLYYINPSFLVTRGRKGNDISAFVIGSIAIWTGIIGVGYCAECFRTRTVGVKLRRVWKWGCIVLKSPALFSKWVIHEFRYENWQARLGRIVGGGFLRLGGFRIMQEIELLIAINIKLHLAVCTLSLLTQVAFGYKKNFAFLGSMWLTIVCFSAKRFYVWLITLHDSIRDERYLIERRILNFGEVKRQ